MNLKLITLILLVVLSIFLFMFISYAEFQEGVSSLVKGGGGGLIQATNDTVTIMSDGLLNTMNTIDKIV